MSATSACSCCVKLILCLLFGSATVVVEFDEFWVQGVNLTLSACTGNGAVQTTGSGTVQTTGSGAVQTTTMANAAPETRQHVAVSTLLTVAALSLLISAFVGRTSNN